MGQVYDEAFAACGLRAPQFSLFAQIERLGKPAPSHLADYLVMDLSALGRTLKRLIRDGFVVLVLHEEDRRARRVYLSKSGRKKLNEARAIWEEVQRSFDCTFGARDA